VGPWRLLDLRGRGAYGAVYLAEGVEPEAPTGPVALKLALSPRDDRFARETGLLSRLRHPAIPRLLEQGCWLSPAGQPHPYFVMEWVEGLSLYEWARFRAPSSRQVLGVLAALARALEAIHAEGGVHRDVKGGNAVVRLRDDQAFLLDFGSCHYRGAEPLTWQVFPPGTPAYRAPEAFRFALDIRHAPVKTWAPGPAEDLFALGVTAYRLVTGRYPPMPEDPLDEESRVWSLDGPGPRPAKAHNGRCDAKLSALISRMLSIQPEARGNARELARALKQAARRAGPEADVPLFGSDTAQPVPAMPLRRSWRPWLVAASLAGPVALGAAWALRPRHQEDASTRQVAEPDAGTIAVGDSAVTGHEAAPPSPSPGPAIGQELPSKPLPGQTRPDSNGRCRLPPEIPINGGCWLKLDVTPTDCRGPGFYVYKGRCYAPSLTLLPPATSAPTGSPDGGG
jgi:serine/threonine-protein kinase